MSPNVRGALLMMASMAAFTLNDTAVRATGGDVPFFQLIFLRGLLTVALILIAARWLGRIHFNIRARDWKLISVRTLAELFGSYFFLTALFQMPLANLSAILQALPLTVSLAAALVFGDALGWRRLSAITIGFVGVLLIVQPGSEGFNTWSLYGVMAVLFVTVRDLATRRLSADVPGMTVTFITAAAVMAGAGLASLTEEWAPISAASGGLIVVAALFILGGYFFSVQTMRVGDVSYVAPFRYTGLIWALVLGWLVFDDWPDALTLVGAAIVVATGVFTLYRERKLSRG